MEASRSRGATTTAPAGGMSRLVEDLHLLGRAAVEQPERARTEFGVQSVAQKMIVAVAEMRAGVHPDELVAPSGRSLAEAGRAFVVKSSRIRMGSELDCRRPNPMLLVSTTLDDVMGLD